MSKHAVTRRSFLRMAALAAGSTVLSACGGQVAVTTAPEATATQAAETKPAAETKAPQPTAIPVSKYKESPLVSDLVQKGQLPPVDERLPVNPLIINYAWVKPGKYGGTMHWGTSSTWGLTHFVQESLYGFNPIRWLDDGLALGPGIMESWEVNENSTQFIYHFRKGMKWSDGQPWTTADVAYWWEDMVLNPDHTEGAPESLRSGTGKVADLKIVDDFTVQVDFDVPAPLHIEKVACMIKWIFGEYWSVPKHYISQFHPKYNSEYKDYEVHDQKLYFPTNPDCPVLIGWKLKSYEEGVRGVWERNPYYYCVDPEGNQLPFIDNLVMNGYQNSEVEKLSIMEGKLDFSAFGPFSIPDIALLQSSKETSKMDVRLWDSGDAGGATMFFNWDYYEDAYRKLFRDPKFHKAISHAWNREEIRKTLYLGFGTLTTGTMSPKALEFNVNEQGKKMYEAWRDNAVEYDPELSKQLLDEIGLIDTDGDGFREFPDGSKFELRLDYTADTSQDNITKCEMLKGYYAAIGIASVINPITPESFNSMWETGQLMTYQTMDCGSDGPSLLLFPEMLAPQGSFWAPMTGKYYAIRNTEQETKDKDVSPWERTPPWMATEPGDPIDRLWTIYDKAKSEPDPMKRHQLVWDMVQIHIDDGPFFIGSVADTPGIIVVKEGLMNVPKRDELAQHGYVFPWIIPCPAVYEPESWYFESPEQHT